MADNAVLAEQILRSRPYYAVPDKNNEDVLRSFVQCFTSPAGQAVLDRLYWTTVGSTPKDLREVGRQDLFREIIDCIQQGIALQRKEDTHGRR